MNGLKTEKRHEAHVGYGIVDEAALVEMFATDKQKKCYREGGNKFKGGKQKDTLLKQASRYCEIEDLGNRKYRIVKVYKYPVPKNFNSMNAGLHQYLTPLILINLIASGIYQVKSLTFTTNKWYRMVDMINDNYRNMKFNIDYTSDTFEISKNVLHDFFNTTDDALVYYFKKSLEHLKAANLFNFQEINWVYVRTIDVKHEKDDKQYIKIRPEHRRATAEEMVYIRKCEELASIHAGIRSDDETAKYYGSKSKKFLTKLKELLLERNILFCYKAYEIYSTDNDIQRCYQLLDNFEVGKKSELIVMTNELFQRNLKANAELRVKKNPEKRGLISNDEEVEFLSEYDKIINLTLAPRIETFEVPEFVDATNTEHIDKIIEDNMELMYNGKVLKIGVRNDA